MAPQAEADLGRIREREGLWPGWILLVGLGTAAFLVISLAGLWLFYHSVGQVGIYPPPSEFPGPHLQSDPAGDLRDFLKAQAEQLQGYAWVDRQRDLIRIPIERAMEIVVARGAAAYDPPAGVADNAGGATP